MPPEVVHDAAAHQVARWAPNIHPDDAPILATAMAVEVDYFVTGNVRHFLAGPCVASESSLRIVTPSQLVELLGD